MWTPLTKSEAHGRGLPVTMRAMRKLCIRGREVTRQAAERSKRTGSLNDTMVIAAYDAAREPDGGITLDLANGCVLDRTSGYSVQAEPTLLVTDPADRCLVNFAGAIAEAASKVKLGQHLGIFHNAEKGTVEFDSVFVTGNLPRAMAVAVASRTDGGIY